MDRKTYAENSYKHEEATRLLGEITKWESAKNKLIKARKKNNKIFVTFATNTDSEYTISTDKEHIVNFIYNEFITIIEKK